MTPPRPRNGLPTETEVRAIVAQIVDGLLDPQAAPPQDPQQPVRDAPITPQSEGGSIAIGADHGGYPMKEHLLFRLREAGHDVVDCGTDSTESVDYPDYAAAVARKVAEGSCSAGIIVDGAGIGSAMVANKVPGVRAALCYDLSSARNSREHNHANVLTLGAGLIGNGLAWQIVQEWIATEWGPGRHARRVAKIDELDHVRIGVSS